MANTISYQCSNCGQQGWAIPFLGIPESMFLEGFRAHGDVLYCPDCVKTWKERNGAEYAEQYNNPPHLFAMWWNRKVADAAREAMPAEQYQYSQSIYKLEQALAELDKEGQR